MLITPRKNSGISIIGESITNCGLNIMQRTFRAFMIKSKSMWKERRGGYGSPGRLGCSLYSGIFGRSAVCMESTKQSSAEIISCLGSRGSLGKGRQKQKKSESPVCIRMEGKRSSVWASPLYEGVGNNVMRLSQLPCLFLIWESNAPKVESRLSQQSTLWPSELFCIIGHCLGPSENILREISALSSAIHLSNINLESGLVKPVISHGRLTHNPIYAFSRIIQDSSCTFIPFQRMIGLEVHNYKRGAVAWQSRLTLGLVDRDGWANDAWNGVGTHGMRKDPPFWQQSVRWSIPSTVSDNRGKDFDKFVISWRVGGVLPILMESTSAVYIYSFMKSFVAR